MNRFDPKGDFNTIANSIILLLNAEDKLCNNLLEALLQIKDVPKLSTDINV